MRDENGFTAIELLITLIIGMMLLFSAYQLYSVVLQSSKDASQRANASSLAYELLRDNSYLATNPCTSVSVPNITIPASANLPSTASASVQISCAVGNPTPNLTQITAAVTYASGKTVVHATYIRKS